MAVAGDMIEISPDADEAQLVKDIYTETQGPRKGIYLTFSQAQGLLRHHNLLPPPTLSSSSSSTENIVHFTRLLYVPRGYNNRVYLATCSDGSEYVIRLGGRFWDHRKITNEEGALHLARQALGDVVRVPRFLATSVTGSHCRQRSQATAEAEGGNKKEPKGNTREEGENEKMDITLQYDYVIMDRLPGVPLDTVWDSMSLEDKKVVVDQVVEIFARLQSIVVDKIGNFVKATENDDDGEQSTVSGSSNSCRPTFEVGALMEAPEGKGGPYSSWRAFVANNLRQEIQLMLTAEGDRFAVLRQYLPRLEALVDKIESGQLEAQFSAPNEKKSPFLHKDGIVPLVPSTSPSPSSQSHAAAIAHDGGDHPHHNEVEHQPNRPIRFMHGDFESRNMLVVGTRVTGLHDFEFAGAYPAEQEWCQSLEWITARAEDPFDEVIQESLRNLTDEQRAVRDYFLRGLQERHGVRPIGFVGCDGSSSSKEKKKEEDEKDEVVASTDSEEGGYLQYKVILYHLQVNVAPWWLRDTSSPELNEKETASLLNAARSLDQALKFLGC
ncbi:hypothetical protein DFQ27_005189 [Actinomortierella ambigua]|uniref:Aminoglycoside phosphotransferase domain-containing protein n=1 Tax=Actinomortierella ambigua TaxID=1343610 RepID=A0A9P6U387_9FUNG|nr:hypothetical protein DFQ27_005189 [Actinomortierella ambigua]